MLLQLAKNKKDMELINQGDLVEYRNGRYYLICFTSDNFTLIPECSTEKELQETYKGNPHILLRKIRNEKSTT